MDWLTGLLLVVVGTVIGFFAARYWFLNHSDSAQLQTEVEASRQQLNAYKKDVNEHFETARQLTEQLQETQEKLSHFLADSQILLQQDKEWQQPLPFFAEDTMRQLRNANVLDNDTRSQSTKGNPPRDYSDSGSGLFSASEPQQEAEQNKET